MKIIQTFTILMLAIMSILIAGCAVATFEHTYPDGSKDKLSTNSLWSNPSINGLDIGSVVGVNSSHVKLDSATNNEVTGLQSFNQALPGIAGAITKGVIEGLGVANGNPGSVKALLK